jgi:hypothetical protein
VSEVLDNLTSNLQTQLALERAVGNLKLLFVLGFVLGKWGYDVLRRMEFLFLFFVMQILSLKFKIYCLLKTYIFQNPETHLSLSLSLLSKPSFPHQSNLFEVVILGLKKKKKKERLIFRVNLVILTLGVNNIYTM